MSNLYEVQNRDKSLFDAVISCFDELWGYTSERSHRLWDEMVPPPTRKIACRLTTTYAGYSGESELLEELYNRGLAQPRVGPDLYAGNSLLMFWTHEPQGCRGEPFIVPVVVAKA